MWFPCFLVLYCLTRSERFKRHLSVSHFFSHKKLVLHAIWGFGTQECEKPSKYTNLVKFFCFLIKNIIHKFQNFSIYETSPHTRVFACFALWFLRKYKTLIIHVSRNVFLFRNIECFASILAFFVGNKLKITHNIPFS